MSNGSSSTSTTDPTQVLALGLAVLAVIIAVIAAGVSDTFGTLMEIFMVGLAIIWLITHSGAFSVVNGIFGGHQ